MTWDGTGFYWLLQQCPWRLKSNDQYSEQQQQQQQQQQGFVGYKYIKHKSVVLVWDCIGKPIRQYTNFF